MKLASVITKVLMALTGLAWLGFLVAHLSGNFLLFAGPEAFNGYAKGLASLGPLLIVAEVGLVALLALHVASAVKVTSRNRQARAQGYEVKATQGQATAASRLMVVGGIVLLTFILLHVATFKFGDHDGENGLWGLVVRTFQNPIWVAWYAVAMAALGLHLSHGFGSAFQTLGIFKPAWRAQLRKLGVALGWLIAAGFVSMPIWGLLVAGR